MAAASNHFDWKGRDPEVQLLEAGFERLLEVNKNYLLDARERHPENAKAPTSRRTPNPKFATEYRCF
jgi:hypothetical protein